jgi:hypothetical protein
MCRGLPCFIPPTTGEVLRNGACTELGLLGARGRDRPRCGPCARPRLFEEL